ncbi:hypothetical protein M3Y99_01385200 [Aphelenchoides fujianensis]|nr:hypothetical protein M3Y99_01385200 [Aphelenchoides fujianensis]
MKRYRFYLLGNVVWCYLIHLLLAFTGFTCFFPSFCCIVEPVVPIPFNAIFPLFLCGEFCVINFALSIVWSLLYRWSQTFTNGIERLFNESTAILVCYLFVHLFMYTTVLGPEIIAFKGEQAVQLQFVQENPELSEWAERGGFFCLPTTPAAHNFVLYVICVYVAFFMGGNACYVVFYRQMRSARRKVAVATTYEMQRVLFVALSFQATLRLENGHLLTTVALALLSCHGVVDYFVMLYFISPWRREIIYWMRHLGGKRTGEQKNQKSHLCI